MARPLIADAVIGADGIHSVVRDMLFGASPVNFTGRVAYRTTYPGRTAGRREDRRLHQMVGRGPPHRHLLRQAGPRRDLSRHQPARSRSFASNSWSAKGDVRELREAFEGFDRQVRAVLAACPDVHKWAIVDRNSLPRWADRNVTLLGDACHPMTPYMAQGAAMAIEDAAVLSRCLDGVERDGVGEAFRRFEATRQGRGQHGSSRPRAPTPGSAEKPMPTGSMATTPGPFRWRRRFSRRPAPPAARLRRCRPWCWR